MIYRFNPTLVRLRLAYRHHPRSAPPSFQSHAGSIEAAGVSRQLIASIEGFNPTLVRLRHGLRRAALFGGCEFQSHAGSIEARPDPGCHHLCPGRFQSHAGSIEAGVGQPMGSWVCRFNPTPVRLRPGLRCVFSHSKQKSFNPTLVRLRLAGGGPRRR